MNSDRNRPLRSDGIASEVSRRLCATSRALSWRSNVLLPLLAVVLAFVLSGCSGISGDQTPVTAPGKAACTDRQPPGGVRAPANTCISTIAGTGAPCPTPSPGTCAGGGLAVKAQFGGPPSPSGVAVDAQGTVYIADNGGDRVDRVSPTGKFATVAGTGAPCGVGSCGDGGLATSAQLDDPEALALDAKGNLYIATSIDNKVRKVASDGTISTVAGTGALCTTPTSSCGDGGPATAAQVSDPRGIALDGAGNLYIADSGDNRIRKVSSDGKIFTIAGNGTGCLDPSAIETSLSPCYGPTTVATAAPLNHPLGVAVDRTGNVYIADESANRVRKVTAAGTISTVAGTGAGGGCDATGNILHCGDGASATTSTLNLPAAVAVDRQGNLYIADTRNNIVREVTTGGTISRVAGSLVLSGYTNACQSSTASCGDGGPATSAELSQPQGIAVDGHGNIYIADTWDREVRKVRSYSVTSNGTGPQGPTPQPPSAVEGPDDFSYALSAVNQGQTVVPVTLDACGSSGTATTGALGKQQALDYVWMYRGETVEAGSTCRIEVTMPTGMQPVTLRVSPPGSLSTSEVTKVIDVVAAPQPGVQNQDCSIFSIDPNTACWIRGARTASNFVTSWITDYFAPGRNPDYVEVELTGSRAGLTAAITCSGDVFVGVSASRGVEVGAPVPKLGSVSAILSIGYVGSPADPPGSRSESEVDGFVSGETENISAGVINGMKFVLSPNAPGSKVGVDYWRGNSAQSGAGAALDYYALGPDVPTIIGTQGSLPIPAYLFANGTQRCGDITQTETWKALTSKSAW